MDHHVQDTTSGEKSEIDSLRERFEIRQAMLSGHEHGYDIDGAWENVRRRTLHKRRTLVRRSLRYAGIVAVCALGVWAVRYARMADTGPVRQFSGVVELVRANGERIMLTGRDVRLEDGGNMLIENDAGAEKLSYDAGRVEGGAAVYDRINVPRGETYTIVLSDGTTIYLNSETTLRFPVRFAKDSRDVYLEGEALFDVAKDTDSPFHVHFADSRIDVLGTVFNVSAYHDEPVWQTVLVEGSVAVNTPNRPEIRLTPDQMLSVDKGSGNSEIAIVDTQFHTSWIDGKYYFNDVTLVEIIRQLQRLYDFDMEYADEELKYSRFSGAINKGRPVEELFGLLEQTNDIRFRIRGREVRAFR